MADIEGAARRAGAHDFITSLPNGYSTQLTDASLSGGQRQRIAIARALITNPKLLILDEATSALDSTTETDIQQALGLASEGRTTLVVAHRLSTIRDVDRVVVMEAGRIAERGSHDRLVAMGGRYAALWQRQEQEEEPA